MTQFEEKVKDLFARHEALITRKNEPVAESNGVYTRYKYPVLTAAQSSGGTTSTNAPIPT